MNLLVGYDLSHDHMARRTRAARQSRSAYVSALLLLLVATACSPEDPAAALGDAEPPEDSVDPWALPPPPPKDQYDGPLFRLSHDYPEAQVMPVEPLLWRQAIGNGTIDTSNAGAYTQALKDYIAGDMKTLLFDYPSWSAAAAGWYNVPWLADIRDPIHGTYVGSSFPPAMFPISKLSADMTTHVLVYYDRVAAGILRNMWGTSGMNPIPGIEAGGAQYAEGSLVVKPAFTTASGAQWPPMRGAFPWQIWARPGDGTSGEPDLRPMATAANRVAAAVSTSSRRSSPASARARR